MLIGVLGAGELENPLLLRLSEHSHQTHPLHTCYQWNIFAETTNTLRSWGISYFNGTYSLYVSLFMLSFN